LATGTFLGMYGSDPEFTAYVKMLRPEAFAHEQQIAQETAAYYLANPDVAPTVLGPSPTITATQAAQNILAQQEAQQKLIQQTAIDVLQRASMYSPDAIPQAQSSFGPSVPPLAVGMPAPSADSAVPGGIIDVGGGGADPSALFASPGTASAAEAGAAPSEGKGAGAWILAALGALAVLG